MARLRTPSRHVHQAHQIVTERNQQRVTDAMPGAAPDRTDGDMSVGNMDQMGAAEKGNTTATRPQSSIERMGERDNNES
jgi:hypothetical protein